MPPEKGRDILLGLQSDPSVPRPDVDEEWVDVDAGEWGTVRTRIIRPKGATGSLPVMFYIHGAGWVFGDDKTHDRLFRELAVGANAAGFFPVEQDLGLEVDPAALLVHQREDRRHAAADRLAGDGDA
ncbi:alpha/beta hydrolase family protein [Streptomyces sp. PanSC9]|nr:alpha/beta hydrolase family protein [Streptomyces sp. PanSC9]